MGRREGRGGGKRLAISSTIFIAPFITLFQSPVAADLVIGLYAKFSADASGENRTGWRLVVLKSYGREIKKYRPY